MNNILLIGFMGSGKSTVSKILGEMLGYGVIDLDDEIEESQGMSIPDIFEKDGEELFRKYETGQLEKLLTKKNKVIATGGGIVTLEENISLMKRVGLVVFLHAEKDQLLSNLKNSQNRPLLNNVDVEKKVSELLVKRESAYMNAANVIIQTTKKTPKAVAEEIIKFL